MTGINRIAYTTFETPDLEPQIDHYMRVLGLTLVARDSKSAYLSASVDHHTVLLHKGASARCIALGFQVAPTTDLADYARQIEAKGIATKRLSDSQPGVANLVTFADQKGTQIEVFAQQDISVHGFSKSGIAPNKIGHLAHNATDVQGAVKFYCDVLGFRVSDWLGDFFAFLRCGPDHHTINIVAGKAAKMHHIAFELRDWAHIKEACDLLATENIPLVWGPVRHGIGHNISVYYRNPDGQMVELFCELDQVNEELGSFEPRPWHQDHPQKPKVWSNILPAANMWGSPPPDNFLD